jgi:hypothetical protein
MNNAPNKNFKKYFIVTKKIEKKKVAIHKDL